MYQIIPLTRDGVSSKTPPARPGEKGVKQMFSAEKIFDLIRDRGIEQKEFARRIGVSDKTVSAWKTGRARSYTKYLVEIAEALSVPVGELVKSNSAIK